LACIECFVIISLSLFEFIPSLSACVFARCQGELTPDDWTKRKDKWRAVLLSIPASFRDFNDPEQPDQVWVQAFNRRQSVKQEHESMSRTAMQMAIEIDQFRTMVEALPGSKGKLQASQLLQEFAVMGLASVHGGIKKDDYEGKLTVNLISQCLAVKKGVLSSERAVEILLEMENCYGTLSPFHQLGRLYIVSTKPSTNQMRWSGFGIGCPMTCCSLGTFPTVLLLEPSTPAGWWRSLKSRRRHRNITCIFYMTFNLT